MTDQLEQKWIAGFWIRIGAFFIDALLLGVMGFVLGNLFEEQFVQIGGVGRLVGFCIAIAYFGIMNSAVCEGQTIGKRLLNLRVVNSNNDVISLPLSLLRYSVFGIPYFLNGAHFNENFLPEVVTYLLALVVFGGLLSTVYLYVFNRTTRQSLHDLCAGTYVVNSDIEKGTTDAIWKPHYYIVACLFLVSALSPLFLLAYVENSELLNNKSFEELSQIRSDILGVAEVTSANVLVSQSSVSSTDITKKYLKIQAFLNKAEIDNQALAQTIANKAKENYSALNEIETIYVTLTYGFDIGIASLVESHSHKFEPTLFGIGE